MAVGCGYFERYLHITPVLWLLGLLIPMAAALLLYMTWHRWPRGRVINTIVLLWCGIGVAQLFAAFVTAWYEGDALLGTLRSAFSMSVLGWIFIGLAIAAGYAWSLDDSRTVRATAMLGLFILVLGGIAGAVSMTGLRSFAIPTIPSLIFPNRPLIDFYFSANFFSTEDTFGDVATRLILFFPWPTALAFGGIGIAMISLCDRSRIWRWIGFTGGAVGVVFSWSRTGIVALVMALAIERSLRLDVLGRAVLVAAASFGMLALVLCGIDPVADLSAARSAVDAARSGSSMARDLIYEKSWEGFLSSPIVGHGWIGPSVHRTEDLPIGSHSTVYGLLYSGGALTFGIFAIALCATFAAVGTAGLAHDPNNVGKVGLSLLVTLLIFSPYEMMFSFSLPCLFMFTWLGASIRSAVVRPSVGGDLTVQDTDRP